MVRGYTVLVWSEGGSGSGISLGEGRVLTNNHVVEGASRVSVRFANGQQEPVRVVRTDPRRDLALLQSSFGEAPAALLRDARSLEPAESLFAVGYPRPDVIGAQDTTVTRGIFSARWESPAGVWHVQTDTQVTNGNSGGPLTDGRGQLVGVITFGVRGAGGLNFAVATDEVQAFLNAVDTLPSASRSATTAIRPVIDSVSVAPQTVRPGEVLRLTYELLQPGSVGLPLTLGASIRPAGGGRWIDDPTNDTLVSIAPGRATYARSFRIPTALPSGNYDIAWGLLGEDLQASFGLEVRPGVLRVLPLVSAPSVSTQEQWSAPEQSVRRFYALLDVGDYASAWALMSPREQTSLNYTSWVADYQTTRGVSVSSTRKVEQGASIATVMVTVMSTDALGGRLVTKTFQGSWGLVLLGGVWRLDTASIRQVS